MHKNHITGGSNSSHTLTIAEEFSPYPQEPGYSAGQVFAIMRAAVTGKTVSPPLFESLGVIGKKKVLKRIRQAIQALRDMGK